MKPDLYWIPGPWRGRLAILGRPRGGDWLRDEARGWKLAGLDVVVSLLEAEEASQLELDGERQAADANQVVYLSHPIPDRGLPRSSAEARLLLRQIVDHLEHGQSVGIHCRQGIGRSGMIAAGALILAGQGAQQAVQTVTQARGREIPETPEQLRWVQTLVDHEAAFV